MGCDLSLSPSCALAAADNAHRTASEMLCSFSLCIGRRRAVDAKIAQFARARNRLGNRCRYSPRRARKLARRAASHPVVLARARLRRRELPPLFSSGGGGRPLVDRHGRAARARGLQRVRACGGDAARGGRQRAGSARAGSRPGVSPAHRFRRHDLSLRAERRERDAALHGRDRRAHPLAAREPARRAAAVRRSAPAARVRAVSRLVHRAPSRADARPPARARRWSAW